MDKEKRQSLKAKKKSRSKPSEDTPTLENDALRSDIRRKHEEIKNSTIGGF